MEPTAANIYKLMQLYLLCVLNKFIIEVYARIEFWMIFHKLNPTSDLLKFLRRSSLVACLKNWESQYLTSTSFASWRQKQIAIFIW